MTTTSRRTSGLETSLQNLAVPSSTKPKTSKAVADTWEEAPSPQSATPSPPSTPTDANPGPPPPTPASPTSDSRKKSTDWSTFASAYTSNSSCSTPRSPTGLEKRPEKSSALAGRLIAGALGAKPPKKTEDSKRYEQAVRDHERKRIEVAKEMIVKAEREKEEARRAIWEG